MLSTLAPNKSTSWIQTHSGQRFDLGFPSADAIDPRDLAVALSRICRYAGHCDGFYSVAQHSVIVCDLVEAPDLKLPALLHDAHEAYWGLVDPQRPIKSLMPASVRDFIEWHRKRVDAAIAERFGFRRQLFSDPRIKLADRVACATEKRDVMGPSPDEWEEMLEPSPRLIRPMDHDAAAEWFLSRLKVLTHVHRIAAPV